MVPPGLYRSWAKGSTGTPLAWSDNPRLLSDYITNIVVLVVIIDQRSVPTWLY